MSVLSVLSGWLTTAYALERQLLSNERLSLGTETNLSAAVRAADIDGDGDLDLVVANGRHWPQQNMIFLNQGRGRFNVARPLGIDRSSSYTCEVADLDGDGDSDIAVANDSAPCLVFLNDGRANFVKHGQLGTPSSVRSLTAADVDADGDIDLLVTCRGRANRIYFNDGRAGFRKSTTFGTSEDSTICVAVADLNEDGNSDFILANRDDQPATILLASAAPTQDQMLEFKKPKVVGATAASSRAVAVADFDSDGHTDWVIGYIADQNIIYFGDGHGGVKRTLPIGANDGRTYCLTVSDLNNDGLPDIISGNAGQVNMVFFNKDGGREFLPQPFGRPDSVTYGLCAGDVTGDGFADVIVANSGQTNQIYVNQPSQTGKKTR